MSAQVRKCTGSSLYCKKMRKIPDVMSGSYNGVLTLTLTLSGKLLVILVHKLRPQGEGESSESPVVAMVVACCVPQHR